MINKMKLLWKIFTTIFISFAILILLGSYVAIISRMHDVEKDIIDEYKIFSSFVSKDIEVSYMESKWPFESLRELSEREEFLFWWVVRDDGAIHLANDAQFMETYAVDYFPEITNITDEQVILNHKKNYGIAINTFEAGKDKWSFWLGFSLTEISEMKKELILLAMTASLILIVMLALITYFTVTYFTKPIRQLTTAAREIKEGNLDHEVKIKSKDEIGELAKTFNEMRLGLKDRNDLLNTLLSTFKGKFGNIATILVRKNVQKLVEKNPRIEKILPKSLGITLAKAEKLQKSRKT